MTGQSEDFTNRLDRLRADLIEQGRRVQAQLEAAFEAVFERDEPRAQRVVDQDDVIDRVDVDLEKAVVRLLSDATRINEHLEDAQLRVILTIVKVNNELERIADVGVAFARSVPSFRSIENDFPDAFRVLANSVIGLMRDTNGAVARSDEKLASVVLKSEDTIASFKASVLRDAEQRIADGTMDVDFAFALHEIATRCEHVADHCGNIAEQIIYLVTGSIVRHTDGGWERVPTDGHG